MNTNLIPIDGLTDCPFPFFSEPQKLAKIICKIYSDGGHYIATPVMRRITHKPQEIQPSRRKPVEYTDEQKEYTLRRIMREKRNHLRKYGESKYKFGADKIDLSTVSGKNCPRSALDILFDSLYFQAFKQGLKDNKLDTPMTDFIRTGILKIYPEADGLDEYIAEKIKRKLNNLLHRKKRFRRKANLNNWTHFVTFTYDDTKHTAETFKRKLRKCLSNLHTRRGWKYMGVFETAPETGRLHFHGLLYVPAGEMIGKITEKEDYDTVNHRMQIRNENNFFAENFGRNDFCEVSKNEMKNGKRTEYIIKYIGKTDERICYSRGIPTEICKVIDGNDIITEIRDFVTKFILFDDIVDWERDIMHYRYNYQTSITDLLCNPRLMA